MAIPIQSTDLMQKCCFCMQPTLWVTAVRHRPVDKQIPCCRACGKDFYGIDVPSARYWQVVNNNFKRESAQAFAAGRKSMTNSTGNNAEAAKV